MFWLHRWISALAFRMHYPPEHQSQPSEHELYFLSTVFLITWPISLSNYVTNTEIKEIKSSRARVPTTYTGSQSGQWRTRKLSLSPTEITRPFRVRCICIHSGGICAAVFNRFNCCCHVRYPTSPTTELTEHRTSWLTMVGCLNQSTEVSGQIFSRFMISMINEWKLCWNAIFGASFGSSLQFDKTNSVKKKTKFKMPGRVQGKVAVITGAARFAKKKKRLSLAQIWFWFAAESAWNVRCFSPAKGRLWWWPIGMIRLVNKHFNMFWHSRFTRTMAKCQLRCSWRRMWARRQTSRIWLRLPRRLMVRCEIQSRMSSFNVFDCRKSQYRFQ